MWNRVTLGPIAPELGEPLEKAELGISGGQDRRRGPWEAIVSSATSGHAGRHSPSASLEANPPRPAGRRGRYGWEGISAMAQSPILLSRPPGARRSASPKGVRERERS